MKKSLMIFALFLIIYSSSAKPMISGEISTDSEILSLNNYVTYYGADKISDIKKFKLAFLESSNYNSSAIENIKSSGTMPVCYVSIGEDDSLNIGDGLGPGGYASWYLDSNGDNKPDQNPYWGSYYVNASNLLWQDRILNQVTPVILEQKGCSGLFLDTIDTIDLYPSTTPGMISLIQQLRNKYPASYLVANRGFSIAWEIAPSINGIMFESFSSRLVRDNRYEAWAGQDLDWTSSWGLVLREIQQNYPIKIFALDYANPSDQVLINYDINRALDYGFIPYVSTINLDNIYFHTYSRQQKELPDGYSDPSGDVRRSQIDIINLSLSSNSQSITLTENLRGLYSSRAYYGVLLDTDFLETTGYKSSAIGADYLMENNILYRYTGNGNTWSWQQVKTIQFSQFDSRVSWTVDLASISSGSGKQLAFTFYAGQANEQDTTVRGKYVTFAPPTTTSTSTSTSSSSTSTSSTSSTTTIFTNQTETTSTSTTSTIVTTIPTSSTTSSTTSTTSTTSTIVPNITTVYLIPKIAYDNYGYDQVSPDSSSLDGTVDLSNNDARWLTANDDYIQVLAWDNLVPDNALLQSVTANCEVDFINTKSGNLTFSFNSGNGWKQACSYFVSPQTTYSCNLDSYGTITPQGLNNLTLRCGLSNPSTGAIGFSIDSINLRVSYY